MIIDELIVEECSGRGHGIGCERVQTNLLLDAVAQASSHIGVGAPLPDSGRQGGELCRRAHLDLQGEPLHVLEFNLARAFVHQ